MKLSGTLFIVPTLVATALPMAHADFIGLNIGANHWTPEVSGSFSTNNDSQIRLDNDLGFRDDSSTSLSVSFEHPVPGLPNIKYRGYDLNASSSSSISTPITFDGTSYVGDINSTLDLSHNDIVLYYELLDNWINIDLGIDLKLFFFSNSTI